MEIRLPVSRETAGELARMLGNSALLQIGGTDISWWRVESIFHQSEDTYFVTLHAIQEPT
jgi:hypothetical protein